MRKINVHCESLLELYRKDFWQDTQKFIRAMSVTLEHIGVPFKLKNAEYALVGKINDKELCCQKLDDKTMWGIEYRTVQDALLGKKRTVYEVKGMTKVEVEVVTADILIAEDEEIDEIVGSESIEEMNIPEISFEVPDIIEEVEVENE